MKERPMLFSAPMVRAIIDGTKMQTRRAFSGKLLRAWASEGWATGYRRHSCPYGSPGDKLWVRETWAPATDRTWYRATDGEQGPPLGWKPSIFMPRWASRITLDVVHVRVERLREISHNDAKREGAMAWAKESNLKCEPRDEPLSLAQLAFSHLWESINGAESWSANPLVWVIEFKRANK